MNPRVRTVQPLENFTLLLDFTNGESKVFDVKPYLSKGVFVELSELDIFKKAVTVLGAVAWPNEIDFCPDTLYLESKPV